MKRESIDVTIETGYIGKRRFFRTWLKDNPDGVIGSSMHSVPHAITVLLENLQKMANGTFDFNDTIEVIARGDHR